MEPIIYHLDELPLDIVADIEDHLEKNYVVGVDYSTDIQRGDDMIITLVAFSKKLLVDEVLQNLLKL